MDATLIIDAAKHSTEADTANVIDDFPGVPLHQNRQPCRRAGEEPRKPNATLPFVVLRTLTMTSVRSAECSTETSLMIGFAPFDETDTRTERR